MHSLPQSIKTRVFAFILAALCASCSVGKSPLFKSDSKPSEVSEQSYTKKVEPVAEPESPAITAEPEPVAMTAAPKPVPVASPVPARTTRIALRNNVPERYTVKKGDTLWDIAALFLQDPWLWPEIWYFNPQINNPHLIYPGDVLALVYIDGQPQLRLVRDGQTATETPTVRTTTRVIVPEAPRGLNTVKLSPSIREQSLDQAIPTIPINAIEPFLTKPQIVSKKELEKAPYVVSSLDQHLATAEGHIVYVRNLNSSEDIRYNIFRPGAALKDPKNGKILGYEATLVSEAKLLKSGNPATLMITRSLRETLNGDRILPADSGKISYNFLPKPPKTDVKGQIIALNDALFQAGQRQIVVINLGAKQGMEIGTVLSIDQVGGAIRDPYESKGFGTIQLPDERAGLLMVFRVFETVSYGLIMESERAIHLHDMVHSPTPSTDIVQQ